MILVTERMMKKLQEESDTKKIKKIYDIAKAKQENFLNDVAKGAHHKKFKSLGKTTNIYKYRINLNERVLYTYGKEIDDIVDDYKNAIVLIDLCKHDEQERVAKNIKVNNIAYKEYAGDLLKENEENIDDIYEDNISDEKYKFYIEDEISIVLDDEDYLKLINKEDVKLIESINKKTYKYYLNREQYKCVKNDRTTILKGSAGSGKTTVLIYKLLGYKNTNYKIAYFTYTNKLKESANIIFENIKPDEFIADVEFYELLRFCINTLGISKDKIVTYKKFEKWYTNNVVKYTKNYIHPIDFWTELKGIIKGIMGINWNRDGIIPTDILKKETMETLISDDFISKNNDVYKINKSSMQEIIKHYCDKGYKNQELIQEIEKLRNYFLNYNFIDKMIKRETYLSLPADYSIFNEDEKNYIYDLSLKYQAWLDENGYYDENDLAILVLKKIKNNEIEKYDYILVDEIQDLTELQILMLIELLKDKSNIFLGGDVHQIVNPTFFNFGRLENGLIKNMINPEKVTLSKNYRSYDGIVRLANKMTEIRRKYIGFLSDDIIEVSIREGRYPRITKSNEENLKLILDFIRETDYAVLIVPNDDIKLQIEEKYKTGVNVFTVQEAKGLEFDVVFCYNILSEYKNYWQDILDGLGKHDSKYRYYFNLFYVAITRARTNLYILEDDLDMNIIKEIISYCVEISDLKDEIKNFEKSSLDSMYRKALEYEEYGLFQMAMDIFKEKNYEHEYQRCFVKSKADEDGYEVTGDRLLLMHEFKDAERYYGEAQNHFKVVKAMLLSGLYASELKFKIIDNYVKAHKVDLYKVMRDIVEMIKEYGIEEFSDAASNFARTMSFITRERLESIKTWIDLLLLEGGV
ncbi:MAG: hypothetical protein JG776_1466 [Caloramator sp.]|jgi:hypothetical protein|uniref:UvrD-helicase domain-containing protein n=1 Tax=Caloramator sp. TaxID=1871330 RepID=UPI001D95341B|nr:UvrD-helicase domain-containing protein [Caloramator sp.]MBZ4663751.1 hypothetical protein [Caloramator sp.]